MYFGRATLVLTSARDRSPTEHRGDGMGKIMIPRVELAGKGLYCSRARGRGGAMEQIGAWAGRIRAHRQTVVFGTP